MNSSDPIGHTGPSTQQLATATAGRSITTAYLLQNVGRHNWIPRGTFPDVSTPAGRAIVARHLIHDVLAMLAVDGYDTSAFLADRDVPGPSCPHAASPPTYQSPSTQLTLARAAVQLYGTYGDQLGVLTYTQTEALNGVAQLSADLSEFSTQRGLAEPDPVLDNLTEHELVGLVITAVDLWRRYGDPDDVLSAFQREVLDRASDRVPSMEEDDGTSEAPCCQEQPNDHGRAGEAAPPPARRSIASDALVAVLVALAPGEYATPITDIIGKFDLPADVRAFLIATTYAGELPGLAALLQHLQVVPPHLRRRGGEDDLRSFDHALRILP